MQCLLCGYPGEEASASSSIPSCSWCREEAGTLHIKEVAALRRLADIRPAFAVWRAGRREDSVEGRAKRSEHNMPVPQPALIFPGLPLYIGDMDDAADIGRLQDLEIGCVVNLCADRLAMSEYADLPSKLGNMGIHQQILVADDRHGFDIVSVAQIAAGCIRAALGAGAAMGVLVHCWGGVNRSSAVAAFYLVTECGVPLLAAVEQMMQRRGTVLTNCSFRKQLVRYCFAHGLSLDSDATVPPPLLMESASSLDLVLKLPCTDASGRKHRKEGTKDTPVYGLLNAAREGCLTCVRHCIEQEGVDPGSECDTNKYTASSWAEWELSRAPQNKRRRYVAILAHLSAAIQDKC